MFGYDARQKGRATFRRCGLERPRDPHSSGSSCVRAWRRHRHRHWTHTRACAAARRRPPPPATSSARCPSAGSAAPDRPVTTRRYKAGAASAPSQRWRIPRVDAAHRPSDKSTSPTGSFPVQALVAGRGSRRETPVMDVVRGCREFPWVQRPGGLNCANEKGHKDVRRTCSMPSSVPGFTVAEGPALRTAPVRYALIVHITPNILCAWRP